MGPSGAPLKSVKGGQMAENNTILLHLCGRQ